MTSLFRPECLAASARRVDGEVLLWAPPAWKLLVAGTAFAMLVGLVVAGGSTYARKETVSGWLVPRGGIIKVVAREGGVVDTVFVKEGDIVAVGALLARLRLAEQISGGDAGAGVERATQDQLNAAHRATASSVEQVDLDIARLEQQRVDLEGQRQEAARALDLLKSKRDLAVADRDRTAKLMASGFISQAYVDAKQGAVLTSEKEVSAAQSNILGLTKTLHDTLAQIAAKPLERRAAATAGDARVAEIKVDLLKSQADHGYDLRSTVAGSVGAVPVDSGQPLTPGATVMVITPAGGHLEAEVYVPSRAVGFVRKGQLASLRNEAFPYQKFGVARGRVAAISRTVLSPSEVSMPGATFTEPVFRVRVALDHDFVRAYGDRIPLQPGMLVGADIEVERRSLLEWLLDPLYAIGRRT